MKLYLLTIYGGVYEDRWEINIGVFQNRTRARWIGQKLDRYFRNGDAEKEERRLSNLIGWHGPGGINDRNYKKYGQAENFNDRYKDYEGYEVTLFNLDKNNVQKQRAKIP